MKRGVVIFSDKKFLLLVSSLLILIVGVSMISANSRGYAANTAANTDVDGEVYYESDRIPASFAEVMVVCEDKSNGRRDIIETTTCDENGKYHISINYADKCDRGDIIIVTANKDGMDGMNSKQVGRQYTNHVDVRIGSAPVVPEFGFFVGVLTIFGAVGVFFIIRKR